MKQQILAEGNDIHVDLQVCIKYDLNKPMGFINQKDFEQNFAITSRRGEKLGKEELLRLIPNVVQMSDFQALGILLDADNSAASTWQSVCNALAKSGYTNLPPLPNPDGTVIVDENPDLPKVGVWIMPDNENPGEIEDFFLQLIDNKDFRLQRVQNVVGELIIERPDLVKASNRSKIETHTWLAWQEESGRSMGLALKSEWAEAKHPLAARLAAWFAATYELES